MIDPRQSVERCFHGGAFFEAIGDEFDDLTRRERIVSADVLDAWFPPAPRVLDALREHLPWLLATSPPTDCGGLQRAIARARGVGAECILPGAGSSALIFLAATRWLRRDSRVLLPDPTYGEYAHVFERVVGCEVERLPLARAENYHLDLDRLAAAARDDFDLVVLVNPNSPTGQHTSRGDLSAALRAFPSTTRVWIDETYIEYVGAKESLEQFAAGQPATIVCKSMSKVYALSGARVAYLCAAQAQLDTLRQFVPPWAVSLPAQVAAVEALQDPDYYTARYRETHALRDDLIASLTALPGIEPLHGVANFVLCHLDSRGPTAHDIVGRCREHGVFVRRIEEYAVRVAVKDAETHERIVTALRLALTDQ